MHTAIDCSVVAVFENLQDAQSAVEDLKTAGLSTDRIYLSSANSAGSATVSSPAPPLASTDHESFTGWLKSLFGPQKHPHHESYERAFSSGRHIVSVEASEAQVHAVSTILHRFSPVDIHMDDYAVGRGISTPDTYSFEYKGSEKSDPLNARDEIAAAATTTGSVGFPAADRAVRVYPKEAEQRSAAAGSKL
ncbi:MAG TPA: hypothetical protein VHZ55_13380, partial [Bryobacteraceae bacterium]|jgi:hypothetical protein|nr:hypothetical protein [Bryobacteraceae bacterium]